LVFLHANGESGGGSERELSELLVHGIPRMITAGTWPADLPFVVLAPQYSALYGESTCAFGHVLDQFLGEVTESYRVDRARVYLTGISCGAIGIWDFLAGTEQNSVAAIVPVSGHPLWAKDKGGCDIATTPTWVFHGSLDDVIPVGRLTDLIEDLRACENPPAEEIKLTIYPDSGHDDDTWDRAYDPSGDQDIYSWLLQHALSR